MCARADATTENTRNNASLSPFEPHVKLPRLLPWFDVDDARAAANGAIFRVNLMFSAAFVYVNFLALAAKWTGKLLALSDVSYLGHVAHSSTCLIAAKRCQA